MTQTAANIVGAARAPRAAGRTWIVTAAVAIIAITVNIPLFNAILVSFKPDGEIAKQPLSLPTAPTLEHYQNVLYASGYDFPRFFANSAVISLGTVVAVLVIAVPATYAIIRLGFGGRWIISSASGLRLLPAIFFVVPFFILFTTLGLQDTLPGLIAANTFLNLPLAIILLSAGLRDIPKEIEEAAAVDGAGIFVTLLRVVLPILGPSLVAVSVLVFIFSWNDYLFALVLSTSNATPVTLGAANFITSTGIRWAISPRHRSCRRCRRCCSPSSLSGISSAGCRRARSRAESTVEEEAGCHINTRPWRRGCVRRSPTRCRTTPCRRSAT